jgi:hypothetical protein
MRSMLVVLSVSVFSLAFAATANAQNPHFVTGVAEPSCSITGTAVTCTGTEIAGVGNNNAVANLEVTATGIVDCNNPGEANRNNPIESHEATFNFSTTSGALEPKNGRLLVPALSATAPTSLTAEQEATLCPNPNWEAVLREGSVAITSFTYTISFLDREGNLVEPAFFTLTGP